jgi:hypothetical protein
MRSLLQSSRLPQNSRRKLYLRIGVVALCLIGAWISLGLAVVYQRDLRPGDPDYGRGTPAASAASVAGRSSNSS